MVSPYFSLKKTDDLFSHRLWKVITFSLTTPSSHVVYPVLNSATKKIILVGCHPGGPPPPRDATVSAYGITSTTDAFCLLCSVMYRVDRLAIMQHDVFNYLLTVSCYVPCLLTLRHNAVPNYWFNCTVKQLSSQIMYA